MSVLSRTLLSVGIAGLFPLVTPVVAANQLVAVSVDGALRASGSSFVDLVEDALSQEGAFLDLAALSQYSVDFDYLGIRRAIRVDAANNGAQITLTIPFTGFSRVFVGATADDVEQQVEDFFEHELDFFPRTEDLDQVAGSEYEPELVRA